jgi:uncharacterized protein YndB with AHSA1/START domain
MTQPTPSPSDARDLILERQVDIPRELIWQAWTQPQDLMPWFCPKPWAVTECEIDLRPGGQFRNVMTGPNGERLDNWKRPAQIEP